MKTKILFGVLFLCLYSVATFAQQGRDDTKFKTIVCDISVDTAFDSTIDYLQDNGYFIVSLEKLSGFIQAKKYKKNKKLISAKVGERRTLNFIIRSVTEEQSSITLNIYCEELTFSLGDNYYYEDKGVSDDRSIYKLILSELQRSLQ